MVSLTSLLSSNVIVTVSTVSLYRVLPLGHRTYRFVVVVVHRIHQMALTSKLSQPADGWIKPDDARGNTCQLQQLQRAAWSGREPLGYALSPDKRDRIVNIQRHAPTHSDLKFNVGLDRSFVWLKPHLTDKRTRRILKHISVSYTHLTLPTNREV